MSRFAFLQALPLIAAVALAGAPAFAQSADEHHEDSAPQAAPAPAPMQPGLGMTGPMMMNPGANGAPGSGMGGMMQMMQMMQSSQMMQMAQMMQMMQMMQQMQGGGMGMPGGAPSAGAMMGAAPGSDVEALIAGYKQALSITEAQAPQWEAFAASIRAGAKEMHAAAPEDDLVPVAEQLQRKAAMLKAELAAITRSEAPAAALYAVLTDAQKRTADRLMAEHLAGM